MLRGLGVGNLLLWKRTATNSTPVPSSPRLEDSGTATNVIGTVAPGSRNPPAEPRKENFCTLLTMNIRPFARVRVTGCFLGDKISSRPTDLQGHAGNPKPGPPRNNNVIGVVIAPVSSSLPCSDRIKSERRSGEAVIPVVSRRDLRRAHALFGTEIFKLADCDRIGPAGSRLQIVFRCPRLPPTHLFCYAKVQVLLSELRCVRLEP
jgi:hypothetical protein